MHADTVRRMVKDGELAAFKGPHVNSPYRISEETIAEWLADHAARPSQDGVAS